jgi:TolA-binding protein
MATALLLMGGRLLADDAPMAPEAPATPEAIAEIAGYAGMARHAAERGDLDVAEKFYMKLLLVDAPDDAKKQALFDMFDCYQSRHLFSKAIAVGERIHSLFPSDPGTPEMLLKLGRLYRETGAYELAIARFYNVLNAALRVDQAEFAKYKEYSTEAQFDIAETFVTSGDYQQATRMYTMLDRLDLSSEQKAHAQFQMAYCGFLMGDYAGAVAASRRFLEAFGNTAYSPQCHYLLSVALKGLNRPQEAADEALSLLRMEKSVEKRDPEAWIYWQRKTGNQMANGFYQEGDFLRALTIYQAMAKMNTDPQWQWPIIYQVGLCFERLRLPDRAREAYQYIAEESKKAQAAGKPLGEDLTELNHMADWRTQHLEWKQGAEAEINDLLGARPPADDLKVTQAQ